MSALLHELEPYVAFSLPSNDDNLDCITNTAFNYKDDRWDLSLYIKNPMAHSTNGRMMFFNDIPKNLKSIIKKYSYYELGRIKPQSVCLNLHISKRKLIKFMDEFGLDSLENFNTERFLQFNAWLRDTYITKRELKRNSILNQGNKEESKKHKPLSESHLYRIALWLKKLLDNALIYSWDGAPKSPIILESSLVFIWNQTRAQQNKKRKDSSKKHIIPNHIWEKIINSAWSESNYLIKKAARTTYEVVYRKGQAEGIKAINFTKYAILIQALTGLRISEIIYLESGCVFKDSKNRKWLRRETTKTVPESQEGNIRIPTELYYAIKELDSLTKDYRKRSGLNNLFFSVSTNHHNKISVMSTHIWNIGYLSKFIKRNNIYDKNGKFYKLRSHDFRHTFASKLVNEYNISLAVLTRHYAHLSQEMTMHYINLSKEKLLKRAIEGFTETTKILTNGDVGNNFVKVINDAQIEDNFDELVDKLSKSFGLTSLPMGLCLYDYRRGHCPNIGVQSCWEIGCSSFVTSNKFLPNFEHEADILECQIARDQKLGKFVEAKKKNIKHIKVVKIIKELSICTSKRNISF